MSHAVWLEQANDDLEAAAALSAVGHHSQAVWLAGQAVEKAHKAILAAMGLQYEERHFKHLGHGTERTEAPRRPICSRNLRARPGEQAACIESVVA